MKVLVTGIGGLLGSEVARMLSREHEVLGLSKASRPAEFKTFNLDITDPEAVYGTISKINPDMVVHSAACSNVDGCEKDPDNAYKVNSLGTRNICLACQRFDTALAYISTDYVFSGNEADKEGFSELDIPDPKSVYARSKFAGEWFVRNLLNKFFIIRTSWLFGHKRDNFVSQVFSALKEGKKVKQASDMVSAPTNVSDLSAAIGKLAGANLFGLYHLSNSGFVSRYEIALFIARLVGCPQANVEKISLKDLNLPAHRPNFLGLNNYAWRLNGFKPLRPWQEAVTEFLADKQ
jgi:dTDP-4-dehydrorhamnose reductase